MLPFENSLKETYWIYPTWYCILVLQEISQIRISHPDLSHIIPLLVKLNNHHLTKPFKIFKAITTAQSLNDYNHPINNSLHYPNEKDSERPKKKKRNNDHEEKMGSTLRIKSSNSQLELLPHHPPCELYSSAWRKT